jgi:hypothetical protein
MHTFAELTIVSAVFSGALVAGCSEVQSQQNPSVQQNGAAPVFSDPKAAADQGLDSLKKMVDAQNYRELGFDAPDEVANLALGERLPIFFVRLDHLERYQAGDDPVTLLTDLGQFFYPVTFMEQARCSIIVERVDGQWRAASLGNAGLARQVALRKGAAPVASVVQVPALEIDFIASTGPDGKLALTPLETSELYGLIGGETRSADAVFAALAASSKIHDSRLPK